VGGDWHCWTHWHHEPVVSLCGYKSCVDATAGPPAQPLLALLNGGQRVAVATLASLSVAGTGTGPSHWHSASRMAVRPGCKACTATGRPIIADRACSRVCVAPLALLGCCTLLLGATAVLCAIT
jgi:hypothetical protein